MLSLFYNWIVQLFRKKWHLLFHKRTKRYHDYERVDDFWVQTQRCSKCNILITYTLGRMNQDE